MDNPTPPQTLEDLAEVINCLFEIQKDKKILDEAMVLIVKGIESKPELIGPVFEQACLHIDRAEKDLRSWWWELARKYNPQALSLLLDALAGGQKNDDPKLWNWITRNAKITGDVDIFMGALARAKEIDSEDLFPYLFDRVLHDIVTGVLFSENDLNKRIFESMAQKYNFVGLVYEDNTHYGDVDLLVAKFHFIESLGMAGGDPYEVTNNAEWMINTLVRNGSDLERPTRTPVDGQDTQKALVNPLHLACWLYERDATSMTAGVAVKALLNCGVGWQKMLEHRNAPKSSALAILDKHPSVRRVRLMELNKTTTLQPRRPGNL